MCSGKPHITDSMPHCAAKVTWKFLLTVRVINQRLQPLGKLRRITGRPSLVNQANIQQIKQMHLVFSTERCQLDLNQRFKRQNTVIVTFFRLHNIRVKHRFMGAYFFAGKDNMNGITRFRIGAI